MQAGAVSLGVLLVAGLLVLIAWRGLGYFWPADIHEWVLAEEGGGVRIVAGQLRRALAPVYFIHGDETLLVNECADAVRAAARAQGFADRQVFSVEAGFDWNSLRAAGDSLSLFADKRLLELRLPTGKPGREGSSVLRDYADAGGQIYNASR